MHERRLLMNINTVVFDLEGTLVDTTELILASFQHVLEAHAPGRFRREDMISFIGPSLNETFQKIDPENAATLVEAYQKHNREHHDDLIKEYPGVDETVATLAAQGWKLGVVTTKRKDMAYRGLEVTGLLPYFSTIVTFNDVSKVKPDPEPIEKALSALEAEGHEAIMVGDSYHDILAGKNAGTKTAGVSWSIKGEDYLRTFQPDIMLDVMTDLLDYVGVKTP